MSSITGAPAEAPITKKKYQTVPNSIKINSDASLKIEEGGGLGVIKLDTEDNSGMELSAGSKAVIKGA